MAQSSEKLITCHGRGAALHDHKAARNVCNVSGFERRSAAGQRNRVGSKNRIARTRDVNSLIASVHGYLREAAFGLEKRHAIAPTRNKKGLQPHFG
jgi:hypothetical protein